MATMALIVTLPALIGDENNYTYAFYAVVSITVIGLYIAYVIPTFLRWRMGDAFEPGPWTLGKKYKWINPAAVIWVIICVIVFSLPQGAAARPGRMASAGHSTRTSTGKYVNYAPIMVADRDHRGRPLVAAQRPAHVPGADPPGRDRRDRPGDRGRRGRAAARRRSLPARVTLDELKQAVADGTVDTVLLAIADMEGRLQGKRLTASHFLDQVADTAPRAATTCSPSTSTWTRSTATRWRRGTSGYGDFEMKPDLDTLRPVPWHEGTVLVMGDLQWSDGRPVVASPRQILRAPARAARRARADRQLRHRARVHRLQDAVRGGLEERLPRSRSGQPLQRRLLDARDLPDRAADPPDPQRDGRRRARRRELEGRVQPRPARDQLPLLGRAPDRRRARDLQERRQGDRRPGGRLDHLHGQVQRARGLAAATSTARWPTPRPARTPSPPTSRCSTASSPASSPACAR